jgi:dihydrolipoamide dehydrogenase
MPRNKYDYDLIVLGTGGGGGLAAFAGLRAGKRVAVAEPGEMGGECPNFGCVPTKALLQAAETYDAARRGDVFGLKSSSIGFDYPAVKAWKDLAVHRTGTWQGQRVFEEAGITVLRGAAHFISPHEVTVNRRHYSARNFLIATGTHDFIPPIEGLADAGYITYKEAIDLTKPPESLFVIGAGPIGCEFTELFSIFGTKVYLSDITPRLLAKEDLEVSEAAAKHFTQDRGAHLLTGSTVTRVTKEGKQKRVHYEHGGKTHSVKVDEVMLAAGRRANVDLGLENAGVAYSQRGIPVNPYLQTNVKHIYAAGDVTGLFMFTHTAEYQSRLAANNMWQRKKIAADYRAVPRCVYTDPEIASVGLSEDDCKAKALSIKKAIAPVSLIGRANTSNVEEGFVKVITKQDGTLLGASIVSPRAGELIHELALAIRHNLTAQQVADTIHAYPTWSEAVRLACARIM